MKYLITTILLIITHFLSAQEKRTVKLEDILDEWVLSDNKELVYENIKVDISGVEEYATAYNSYLYYYRRIVDIYLKEKHTDKLSLDSGVVIIPKNITFRNVEWPGELELWNLAMISLNLENVSAPKIDIRGSEFQELNVSGNKQTEVVIIGCESPVLTVEGFSQARIQNTVLSNARFSLNDVLQVSSCFDQRMVKGKQHPFGINKRIPTSKHVIHFIDSTRLKLFKEENVEDILPFQQLGMLGDKYRISITSEGSWLTGEATNRVSFNNNSFHTSIVEVRGKIDNILWIQGNAIGFLIIQEDVSSDNFKIKDNNFSFGVVFKNFFTETDYEISWKDVSGKILAMSEMEDVYLPTDSFILGNRFEFYQVAQLYQPLVKNYRERGNKEDANEAIIELKELETARYGYLYQVDPSFSNLFRFYLNRLLFAFVRYGTDPARAIVISVYVILIFAIFYVFFPSEWDVASKSKMVKDFREFIGRNRKGYVKPFLRLIAGLLVSIINAITLSLNSFVTLGFGTIPTRGLARYVCILQGFIGWFLLSIFTVALISQVMI